MRGSRAPVYGHVLLGFMYDGLPLFLNWYFEMGFLMEMQTIDIYLSIKNSHSLNNKIQIST